MEAPAREFYPIDLTDAQWAILGIVSKRGLAPSRCA